MFLEIKADVIPTSKMEIFN